MKEVWLCPACDKSHSSFDSAADCCEPERGFECEICTTVYRDEKMAAACPVCTETTYYGGFESEY